MLKKQSRHSAFLLTSGDKMEAVWWQFVQLVLWCSWSLVGSQAAATGAFHSQHSAHHVTQAANQVAQAACLQTSQFSPGPFVALTSLGIMGKTFSRHRKVLVNDTSRPSYDSTYLRSATGARF